MKGKQVGSVLGDILEKEKKNKKPPEMAEVEIDIEPLDDDEAEDVMDDMEQQRLDSAKSLMGILGVTDADDDRAADFAAELENFLSIVGF